MGHLRQRKALLPRHRHRLENAQGVAVQRGAESLDSGLFLRSHGAPQFPLHLIHGRHDILFA